MSHAALRSSPRSVRPLPAPGARPLLSVVGEGLVVPLASGDRARFVNLDYAASAPALSVVKDAIDALLPWYSSVHRGAGFPSRVCTELLTGARESVASFVGARSDDAVVFTRNTTDALNLLASALPDDTTIVSFASEHHANLLPWRRVRRGRHLQLPVPKSPEAALARVERALAASCARHRLVAVTGASNVTGELFPIAALAQVAHRHGARLVVDAAQLAPHRALDLAALGADWIAFSGHKLYAPHGAGALVGRADWLDAAEPWLAGGGAVRSVSLDDVDWNRGPARHEAGTPNLIGAVALGAACRALSEIGMANVAAHEAALLDHATRGLRSIGVEPLAMFEHAERIGVVSFVVGDRPHGLVASALSAEHGVGVRDGAFCAHPLVRALVGDRGGAVRASFGVGSTLDDVDRLLDAIASIASHGPRLRHRLDEHGRWVPEVDARTTPDLHPLLRRVGARVEEPLAPCVANG